MLTAPIPHNDRERLAALDALQLLDTPHEERFDRITRLLTLTLDVPIAYISLISAERQWFKSTQGLGCSRQTPRDISFCGHAILADHMLVVPDARLDERFHDNPLVTGDPWIRFYAGQPLEGPDGHKVGTLCIADRRPRTLNDHEATVLRELAGIVERELNLVEVARMQQQLIAAQEQRLREISQAASYVRSLLPTPLDGDIRTRWRFEPSSELGGDCFGYEWLDDDHFAAYVLDVSGHGVGAALLSVSVMNTLRSRALPDADFRDPASVLTRLNDAFSMERQDGKYFTIWYGVFNRRERTLNCCSGGHPPAVLMSRNGEEHCVSAVGEPNFAVGMLDGVQFTSGRVEVPPRARLYVFSDGVYEIPKPDQTMGTRDELVDYLTASPSTPDTVWEHVLQKAANRELPDDFSLLEVEFH
jgi:sigma-B regulation protein RsbU (phosphoserine phosphatase)